ncbi:MAG TPA: hypothetical protein VFJ85_01955 [Acidimicrobiales bacterium]|nr:hypothetical protein [Acidimicrobiales bacterium]
MTAERPYEVTVIEHAADGTTKELVGGRCSAFVLAICADVNGELRLLTLHEGPTGQRRKAISALSEHIRATIGLGR